VVGDQAVIGRSELDVLFVALRARGFRVVGPVVRDGAVVLDDLASAEDLPAGWRDEQEGGHYRLRPSGDEALFSFANGPQSWRRFLFPPSTRLWRASRTDDGFEVHADAEEEPRYAFVGVRACDLRAMGVQDKVFMEGPEPDPGYAARRATAFVIAVNCGEPGGTCFCVSMGTGPKAEAGFDLALTELVTRDDHRFLVEVGSDEGASVLAELEHGIASDSDVAEADAVIESARARMGRSMEATGLRELLAANYEHPRWDEVAQRCLTCANCTLVCPTCFCSTVDDVADVTGDHAERWRRWDSCFTADFSYIHGGSVRASTRSRYRQWLTHKLGTWHDQFGESGCVGCGRCITWCPVGIDLTEEIAALRAPPVEPASEDGPP
jgi:sulfhydrogenase subunit beta (sulfur reductase)